MRILFCNYEYPPLGGGGGVINAHLAEELAKKHDVSVLTSRALGVPEREIVGNVEVFRVPVLGRNQAAAANMVSMATFLPAGMIHGRKLLKQRAFDVINTHFVVPTGPVGAYLSRVADVPNVLAVHGGDLYDPSKASSPHRHFLLRMLIRRLLRNADEVVGQSINTVENVNNIYDDSIACKLIPLGIRRPIQTTETRQGLGFRDDEKLLVTVGRLVARKGLDQLVSAMQQISDSKARLIVIGDGPMKDELVSQVGSLGLTDRVVFAGFVDEQRKHNLLSVSDLYVSTSQHEGFGLVFLEGMAVGLPVICYDFGGQTDFLTDGTTGGVVPLNDLTKFVRSVDHFLASEGERRRASEENLRRVESYFIDQCARKYEELFGAVIESRASC